MRMSAEPECIEITVYFWFEIFATHDESRAQASAAWDLSPALVRGGSSSRRAQQGFIVIFLIIGQCLVKAGQL
jgi:hypothetical protein